MIQTMFLCAGLGTRLLPLTRELPKPMVPLGDRPILSHLVAALARAGGTLRAVNTHHRPEAIADFVRSLAADVYVSHEAKLRGTAGGIRAALAAFSDAPLLVWNADIVTIPPVSALVRALDRFPLALAVEPQKLGQGNVGCDASGRVVRLRQYARGPETIGGNYVGVLAMRPDCLARIPESGCLIGDVAIPLMEGTEGICAVRHETRWTDIGSLEAYLEENMRWLQSCGAGDNWIHSTARVERSVDARCTIVGRGALINGRGRVERVVVWPGASCVAPLTDAIVTPEAGVVPVYRNPGTEGHDLERDDGKDRA